MKEGLLIFRPNKYNLAYAIGFMAWQYFYSFVGSQIEAMAEVRNTFSVFLNIINWENSLIRGVSMFFIWIIVAIVVFVFFVAIEGINVFLHNKRVEASYVNRSRGEAAEMVKRKTKNILLHLEDTLWFSGGLMLVYLSLNQISDFFESIRIWIFDAIIRILSTLNQTSSPENLGVISSFLICLILWWFIGSVVVFLFRSGYLSHKNEEMLEDHFGAVIES